MTGEFVMNYIDKKLEEDEHCVIYTFYELRIKNNLSEEDVANFLIINKDFFENKGYKVFFTGDKYEYKHNIRVVQSNELMVAVKER